MASAIIDRAELPVHRNRTLKCGVSTGFSPNVNSTLNREPERLCFRLTPVGSFAQEYHHASMDLVPQLSEGVEARLSDFGESCWVLKGPMEPLRRPGENWALLTRLVTD